LGAARFALSEFYRGNGIAGNKAKATLREMSKERGISGDFGAP
jgi:hypothetical protein